MTFISKYAKHEKFLFLLLIVANFSILFFHKFFVTLDGPAHHYNANIISDLVFSKDSFYSEYFGINKELLPNGFSYVLLIILRGISPFFVAEKLLLVIHFIVTPLFFRRIVLRFNPDAGMLAWIIFPFTHFSLLYMGFFNFCIGVAAFFVCLDLYLNAAQMSLKRKTVFFLMLGVLYFSHVFCFLVLLMFIGFNLAAEMFSEWKNKKSAIGKWVKMKLVSVVLPVMPFFVLSLLFFLKRPTDLNASYLTKAEVSWFFTNLGPLQAYGIEENFYCKSVFIFVSLLMLICIWKKIRAFAGKNKPFYKIIERQDVFLVMFFILALLSYALPNEDGNGGYITARMVLFSYFFLLLFIASSVSVNITSSIIVGLIMLTHIILLTKREPVLKRLNTYALELNEAANYVEEGKIVAPVMDCDKTWQAKHFSNYLAAEKNVMVMENYEAETRYFPVVWKEEKLPVVVAGNHNFSEGCVTWKSGKVSKEKVMADYVIVFDEGAKTKCMNEFTNEFYNVVYKKDFVTLLKLKH